MLMSQSRGGKLAGRCRIHKADYGNIEHLVPLFFYPF